MNLPPAPNVVGRLNLVELIASVLAFVNTRLSFRSSRAAGPCPGPSFNVANTFPGGMSRSTRRRATCFNPELYPVMGLLD